MSEHHGRSRERICNRGYALLSVFPYVWHDQVCYNDEIFYKQSTDLGISWSVTKRLTFSSDSSENPSISADSEYGLHVVWQEYNSSNNNFDIFYKIGTNYGSTWSAPQRLSWNPGFSINPTIVTNPQTSYIFVFWQDNSPGNYEIFYKQGHYSHPHDP